MTKYFQLWASYEDDDYANFILEKPLYEHFGSDILFFSGKSLRDVFPRTQIAVKQAKSPPDFYLLGSIFFVSERLRYFLEKHKINAEYIELSVTVDQGTSAPKYYFMNILDVLDCFDREKSVFEEFSAEAGGGILTVKELHLKESIISGKKLFLMNEPSLILVREDFAESLLQQNFIGIGLKSLPKGPF